MRSYLHRLARLDRVEFLTTPDAINLVDGAIIDRGEIVPALGGLATFVVDDVSYTIPFEGNSDFEAERTRLSAAITAITKERDSLTARLNNPAFIEKAKPEAVEKARADHAEKVAEADRLQAALARLG